MVFQDKDLRMDSSRLETVLAPYNPWWKASDWDTLLPDYRRPIVGEVLNDLKDLPQIVSVTGPSASARARRVTHVISHLIREDQIDPQRIVYFSLDDPEVFTSEEAQRVVLDLLFERFAKPGEVTYVFLDEIQRLPRWELFLKKAYDLRRPLRFVISGSASSPIFRSGQESLLGRIKDRHLLPSASGNTASIGCGGNRRSPRRLAAYCHLKAALLASRQRGGGGLHQQTRQSARSVSTDRPGRHRLLAGGRLSRRSGIFLMPPARSST